MTQRISIPRPRRSRYKTGDRKKREKGKPICMMSWVATLRSTLWGGGGGRTVRRERKRKRKGRRTSSMKERKILSGTKFPQSKRGEYCRQNLRTTHAPMNDNCYPHPIDAKLKLFGRFFSPLPLTLLFAPPVPPPPPRSHAQEREREREIPFPPPPSLSMDRVAN